MTTLPFSSLLVDPADSWVPLVTNPRDDVVFLEGSKSLLQLTLQESVFLSELSCGRFGLQEVKQVSVLETLGVDLILEFCLQNLSTKVSGVIII